MISPQRSLMGSVVPLLALLALAALGASCTLLVKDQLEDAPQPCASASDCFAGHQCVMGACAKAVPPAEPPPAPALTVGPEGGTVIGPDGTRLVIPEGALERDVEMRLERASMTVVPRGVHAVSRVYLATPTLSLSSPARIEIPVDASDCGRRCEVYAHDGERWAPLPVSDEDGLLANAAVTSLGMFVVGATPDDAGDGGTPAPASCNFTAGSCAPGERCVADPFAPAEGLCLSFCDASAEPPPGCGCCASLDGEEGALCLPEALCGTGVVGAACPSGTADCDPRTTDACELLAGAPEDASESPICTHRCDSDADCGDGCCVANDDGERFCQVAAACGALPLGARCADDGGCASGRCASFDGVSAPRCTDTCARGGMGGVDDGLCCFPETCAGNGLLVLADVCAARTTTICGDVCVSDAACGNGAACLAGTCQPLPEGACARHAHCDVDARCDLATAFEEAPSGETAEDADDDTALGTCVPREAGACYADLHCPPADLPSATLCRKPESCDDEGEACAGACAPPAPGECVSSDDCDDGEACIAHRCL